MRYEIKLPADPEQAEILEIYIKLSGKCFNESYPERRICNIYLDDYQNSSYFENLDGLEKRIKYRIRWYGEKYGMIEPALELKFKTGFAGGKLIYPLKAFNFVDTIDENEVISCLLKNDLPENVKEEIRIRKPVLFNSYLRKYYESFCKKFRITIDKEIEYKKISVLQTLRKHSDDNVVLELKYKIEDEKEAASILNELPVRINKNSKFVRGTNRTQN